MIYEITDPCSVLSLYDGWEETMIWSCLQGIIGKIYADDPRRPASAAAFIGDFAFFAGGPCEELAAFRPSGYTKDFILMVPGSKAWEERILLVWGAKARSVSRYATRKEPDVFDENRLMQIAAALPEGCQLSLIDEHAYQLCRSETWCSDLVSQFPDYDSFRRLGLGVVVLKDGAVVSGASSYTRYRNGIEIEVDTKEGFRRRGLAAACAAKLILECRKRDLYPSWDAHTRTSLALAEKLGYHYSHTYTAVEIRGY